MEMIFYCGRGLVVTFVSLASDVRPSLGKNDFLVGNMTILLNIRNIICLRNATSNFLLGASEIY